jgi:hypothetical protein
MVREEVAPDRASAWSLPDLVVTVCLGQEFQLGVFDDSADRFDQNESPEKRKPADAVEKPDFRAAPTRPQGGFLGLEPKFWVARRVV